MSLEQLINQYHQLFTETDFTIINYLLNHQNQIQTTTLTELAEKTHTSNATIIRLLQKMHFSGFSEFKYFMKKKDTQPRLPDTYLENLYGDLHDTTKMMMSHDFTPLIEAIRDIKQIFVYGTGWSEQNIANILARNFLSVGKYMTVIPSISELKWNISNPDEKTLLIVASLSGENIELVNQIRNLALKNIDIVSITELQQNTLATLATHQLYYQTTPVPLPYGEQYEIISHITLYLAIESLFRNYLEYISAETNL